MGHGHSTFAQPDGRRPAPANTHHPNHTDRPMETQITNVIQAFQNSKQYVIPSYQRTPSDSYLSVTASLTDFVDPVLAV